MTREPLPPRRKSWIQKVHIEGNAYYLCCGEYPDGRLGEFFVEAHKEGTFARGVLGAVARVSSIALQCGAPVDQIVKALRHLNFPPRGLVIGSSHVERCSSVCDWIAQEIEHAYVPREKKEPTSGEIAKQVEGQTSPPDLGTTTESSF